MDEHNLMVEVWGILLPPHGSFSKVFIQLKKEKKITRILSREINQSKGSLTLRQTLCVEMSGTEKQDFFDGWWTSFSTQYKSCLSERTERASYNDWGSSEEGLEGGAIALFPYQRSLKVKCLLNFGNTVWLWTLRLLHWPVKTPQWRRSHYPDKASELIELEGPSDPVMRSPHNPPTLFDICLFFFFLFVAFHLRDHFTPRIILNSQQALRRSSASLTRPLFLMDFSCFIEIPFAEVWGTLIKMSWEDESREHAAKIKGKVSKDGREEERNGLEVEKQDLLK